MRLDYFLKVLYEISDMEQYLLLKLTSLNWIFGVKRNTCFMALLIDVNSNFE